QIEAIVREKISRGTAQVNLKVDRARGADDYTLNETVLESYYRQLASLHQRLMVPEHARLENILLLPGVVDENLHEVEVEQDWPLIESTLREAVDHLHQMRGAEGAAMKSDLIANIDAIEEQLGKIEARAPLVVDAYRGRLAERINKYLAEHDVSIETSDLIREVGFFAERTDIAEETVRLRSHLQQFRATLKQPDSHGKKLDFVTQEMFRETNTIGSKANDMEIARHVIEIKAAIERIREMVQNVE
ncbi:MAG: DUF1732 domain-containing protein, partial [Pirellulales bacterium]